MPHTMDKPIRLLLVDDDRLYRRALRRSLRRHGFEVTEAESVREAAALIHAHNVFDIVAVDLVMPQIYGDVLARELAKTHPHLPVRILSAHAGGLLDEDGFIDESTWFITKNQSPYGIAEELREAAATRCTHVSLRLVN